MPVLYRLRAAATTLAISLVLPSALVSSVLVSNAQAYVPPSFFVIRMLARKHSSFENGKFKNKLTFYKSNGEVSATLIESLTLSDAEHAAIRISDASGAELAAHSRKLLSGRTVDGSRPVAYDLLFLKDSVSMFEHFKTLGLPLKTESALYAEKEGNLPYKPEPYVAMERFENKVAVVIGDRTKKSSDANSAPSLWIEKDSFLPLRAIVPSAPESGMASEPLEYRLGGYSVFKNFLYPKTLTVYRSGNLWLKVETQDVRPATNASTGSPNEGTRVNSEATGDLKENLDAYFKWIR